MAKRYYARSKTVNKITRDGLVERDLATGAETRISQRGQDFNLRQEDGGGAVERATGRAAFSQKHTRTQQRQAQINAVNKATETDLGREHVRPSEQSTGAPSFGAPDVLNTVTETTETESPLIQQQATPPKSPFEAAAPLVGISRKSKKAAKRAKARKAKEAGRLVGKPVQSPKGEAPGEMSGRRSKPLTSDKSDISDSNRLEPDDDIDAIETPRRAKNTTSKEIPRDVVKPPRRAKKPIKTRHITTVKQSTPNVTATSERPRTHGEQARLEKRTRVWFAFQRRPAGRLRFSDKPSTERKDAKNRQRGTQYYQRFNPEVGKPKNPLTPENNGQRGKLHFTDMEMPPAAPNPTTRHNHSENNRTDGARSQQRFATDSRMTVKTPAPDNIGKPLDSSSETLERGDNPSVGATQQAAITPEPIKPFTETATPENPLVPEDGNKTHAPIQNASERSITVERSARSTTVGNAKSQQKSVQYYRRFIVENPVENPVNNQTPNKPPPTQTQQRRDPENPQRTEPENPQRVEPQSKFQTQSHRAGADAPRHEQASRPGKLRFTQDEEQPSSKTRLQSGTPGDKKLDKLEKKADKAERKLDKARDRLPTKKRVKLERSYNEAKKKPVRKLTFEKEIIPIGERNRRSTPAPIVATAKGKDALIRAGAEKLHYKIHEVEHENVGVKAAHRTEKAAEELYRQGKRVTRQTYQFVRNRPYRVVEKREIKARKANVKRDYRRALVENPKLKSNIFSRTMQKRKIKQKYAQAAREAKKAGETLKRANVFAVKRAKALTGFIRRHPFILGAVLLILFVFVFVGALFASCSNGASGGFTAIASTLYLADDDSINNAELSYTEWETDLKIRIRDIENEYTGYHEYRYSVDGIGHDPFELMAFLTAVYGEFNYSDVESALRWIFETQYQLELTEESETRYRTVTLINPYTGEEYEDMEAYTYRILNVTLTSLPLADVLVPLMDASQLVSYNLLMSSHGNRQYVESPFEINWLPLVTSGYGYRIHPITGERDLHKGVDIAVPTGTPIRAGISGFVTSASYDASYGYYIVVSDGMGLEVKYAHCDSLLRMVGEFVSAGEVVAMSGNTGNSTGPHLHMEVVKDGVCYNPAFFTVAGLY